MRAAHYHRYLGFLSMWVLLALTPAAPAAEGEGKYIVGESTVQVRSGPGEDYFATSTLKSGTEVDVYRIDQGDWAAIRPPPGSFSWIEADALEREGTTPYAKVVRGGVRTRVGGTGTQDRHVAYLTLREGEQVRLLNPDEKPIDGKWRRIMPLSGEFRWVPLRRIAPVPAPTDPGQIAATDRPHAEIAAENSDASDRSDPTEANDSSIASNAADAGDMSDAVVRAQWSYDLAPRTYSDKGSGEIREGGRLTPRVAQTVDHSIRQAFGELRPTQDAEPPSSAVSSPELLPPPLEGSALPPPPIADPLSATPFTVGAMGVSAGAGEVALQEVIRISAELSLTVANSAPLSWNLGPLRGRAQAVIDADGPAEVHAKAQELIARIAQFDDLQRRHRQLAPTHSAVVGPNELPGVTGGDGGSPPNPTSLANRDRAVDISRYDGYGWLMPVLTKRPNLPRYVLTDNQGNILQFVSPRPGLNLSRYEKQRVGIFGERDFLPSVSQPHLVAERIVTMDRLR